MQPSEAVSDRVGVQVETHGRVVLQPVPIARLEVRTGVPRDVAESFNVGAERLRDDLSALFDERVVASVVHARS